MKNKIFALFIFMSLVFCVGTISVYADCDDCGPNNCGDCGCVVDSSKTHCVYANYDKDNLVSCGNNNAIQNIPKYIPVVVNVIYIAVQIAVPVVLVIFGMLDLFKGITAQKEDQSKQATQMFVKRLIAAFIIFFVFAIVKFVVSYAAENNSSNVIDCLDCFIRNKCSVG